MSAIDPRLQLFGIAFAGADVGFEVDKTGKVVFALGAVTRLTGLSNDQFVGSAWADLIDADDVEMVMSMVAAIKTSERRGPLRVKLKRADGGRLGRYAALSMFRLPREDGAVSCVLSLGGVGGPEAPARATASDLIDQDTFAETAAKLLEEAEEAGLPLRMELVELKGFAAQGERLAPADAAARKRQLGAALRAASYGGMGAAEMADDRFALLRSGDEPDGALDHQLSQVAPGLKPVTSTLTLGSADSAGQNLRAMRYALDRFIEDGPKAAEAGFKSTVERTLRETAKFKATLAAKQFFLAYQPVVDVVTGETHHYEALARFDPNAGAGDTIRLAEELNLIADFDKVVFANVAEALKADPSLKIAVNLSGITLMQNGFLDWLDALPLSPEQRKRMPIEVTESATLSNLAAANIVLKAVRRRGHQVCLDDFGCGGASLDYLRSLECDVVKFDGRYVQGLATDPRDIVVLKHLVAMCKELELETIAEMIETPEVAVIVKKLGVTYGQGWHYGKPTAQPKSASSQDQPLPVRRVGEVNEWR